MRKKNPLNIFLKVFEEIRSITKTRLYNFDPLKPHFYIVKLVFTGVCIIFSCFCSKSMFWAETWKISAFLIWKWRLKNEFELTMINVLSGFELLRFELLRFDCIYLHYNWRYCRVAAVKRLYNIFIYFFWFFEIIKPIPGVWKIYTLRKHAYSNILKILPPKNENFQMKKFWYFSYFCSKHRLWVLVRTASPSRGGSYEYPQSMFSSKNKENNVYPL